MENGNSVERQEIAKFHYSCIIQQAGSDLIPDDGEMPKEDALFPEKVELNGQPESWILLDCPNRLVNRYDPAEAEKAFNKMAKDSNRIPLYVGIDAFTLHPVFKYAYDKDPDRRSNDGQYSDDDQYSDNGQLSVTLRAIPGDGAANHPTRVLIIPHQSNFYGPNCYHTVVGSVTEYSREYGDGYSDQRRLNPRDITEIEWSSLEQIKSLKVGDVIKPLYSEEPHYACDMEEDQGEFWFENHVSDYILELPRLTKAIITPKLLELANGFQRLLSRDNIHMNEIIMAMFVWSRHESSPTRLVEDAFLEEDGSYIDSDPSSPLRIPRQKLIDFVALWPHYLRFHEIHKLGTHIHPFRFVNALKDHEDILDPTWSTYFQEKEYAELEERVMSEVSLSGLNPYIDWREVLPSTLKGSRARRIGWRPWPKDLWESFAMPDINMTGLPAYPVGVSPITRIIIPMDWANPVVDRTQSWKADKPMVMDYSVTSFGGLKQGNHVDKGLRLISGTQLMVAVPPQPLLSSDDPRIDNVVEGDIEEEGKLVPGTISEALSPAEQVEWRKMDLETRLSVARESGVAMEELAVDELGMLTWPGFATSVKDHLKQSSPAS